MQHFRYTDAEIAELCKIPPWTESALDKHAKQIHTQVPITRKCIVNQCLFWCDVAQRFKRNLHGKRRPTSDTFDPQGGDFVVGVIGCGSIGSKFVRELLQRQIVEPGQIKISSRTPSRAKQRCGLEAVSCNADVASRCTILFLFVLPFHYRTFSREIRDMIQRTKPLIISTLAGYTQTYLQRALNTRYLITTAVDLPTVHVAANRVTQEFPFAGFATGAEMARFQDYFSSAFAKPPEEAQETADAAEPPPEGAEGPEQAFPAEEPIVNPFQVTLTDQKEIRHLHQAAFAAENLANVGIAHLNGAISALRDWVALDSNHSKIQARPVTYNRLWDRSFIPLPCIIKLESVPEKGSTDHEAPVRFLLKRAFVRSLAPQVQQERERTQAPGNGASAYTARPEKKD
jgi:hypothetical protein